ncbi:MAG: glycine--tRNA ligase subunit beta [Candidatus Eisenbacteria bacterium]|nr:glycine--tRNA ligase subunit beta [Candidatus Eisenbacteria bacterium]
MTRQFLLEIGTEEIPAGYLCPAGDYLHKSITDGLAERRLPADRIEVHVAPRRLIVLIHGLADGQADLSKEVMGPASKAAFTPDGALTRAGEGFARGQGALPSALRRVETPKGEYVAVTVHVVGRPVGDILLEWLPDLIRTIPFPKSMKWCGDTLRFARPIRWLVALLDQEVVPLQVGSIQAGRTSRGHRLVTQDPVVIDRPESILPALEAAGVLADFEVRRARVRMEIESVAGKSSTRIVSDDDLVDEVTNLVEWPTAVIGSFDAEYLALPREVIITAMKAHQRYFAVEGLDGVLRPNFITVANGRWDDTSRVVAGNERVLRARLADARFYWDTDRKIGLVNKVDELKSVVWLEGAGTLHDRVIRIERMVDWLGRNLRTSAGHPVVDAATLAIAARVAHLAKADLATDMIRDGKEFTSLQGIIGGHYARIGGEPEAVVTGISEHYLPKGPGDSLPSTTPGLLVSLADRLDVIVGCFAIGLIPSGSQDPYALRRAANGIMRMLLEMGWHIDLTEAIVFGLGGLPGTAFKGPAESAPPRIQEFLRDRLDYFLRESGQPYDVVAATLAGGANDPVDARARGSALAVIRGDADLAKLVIGYKRAANILKGVTEVIPSLASDPMSGAEPVEAALHAAAVEARAAVDQAIQRVDYPAAVAAFLKLRAPIDAFFAGVMVMSKDDAERHRRLGLLVEVRSIFDRLFDLSKIVVEG